MIRKIFLMRHADPNNPHDLMYGNLPGFALSDLGIKQAEEAGKFMSQYSLDLIVSSDLERAKQTSEIIAQNSPNHPQIIVDPRFRDVGIDAWQGKVTLTDWTDHRIDYWQKQYVGEDGVEIPSQTQSRIVNAFDEYIQKYPDKNIIFVFHADPISFLVEFLLGKELYPGLDVSFGKIKKANILEVKLGSQVLIDKIFQPSL